MSQRRSLTKTIRSKRGACLPSGNRARDLAFRWQMRAIAANLDVVPLVLLSVLWIVMSALVNPIGDFPLDDDWVYGFGVRSIVESGRFELPNSVANLFAQAYWGALFCLPFGFSFTALRFSTLTLGGVGIIAFYLLLREIGGDRWIALLGGFTLAVNPIYFGLANTFMTDVPFLALTIAALWLFVRGMRREHLVSLLAGILIALLAVLVRQFALILLFAFGIAYVMNKGMTWEALVFAFVPLLLGSGLHFFYQHWMIMTGRTPYFGLSSVSYLIPTRPLAFAKYSLRHVIFALPYLGFFVAPFLASIAPSGSHVIDRNRRLLFYSLIMVMTAILSAALYKFYIPIPEIGHILTPAGLGPRTLRDTFLLGQNLPVTPAAMSTFWFCSIALGILGGAGVLFYLAEATLRVVKGFWRSEWRRETWLEALILAFVCAYATLLVLFGFGLYTSLFDRYLLVFVPAILLLVLISDVRTRSISLRSWRGALSLGLVLIYAAISMAGTHDYLAWNRSRWLAISVLIDAGVSPHHIDGGYEFNGWYLYDPQYHKVPDKSWWWVDDDEYMLASGLVDGYRELQRFPFRRWLTFSDSSVVVLLRADTEHR
jgi:4-amino-4-deoxy-L-arabinose transferase-like glycosyltransferase